MSNLLESVARPKCTCYRAWATGCMYHSYLLCRPRRLTWPAPGFVRYVLMLSYLTPDIQCKNRRSLYLEVGVQHGHSVTGA